MQHEWPRERLFRLGTPELSLQELISVLLVTGNKSKSVFLLSAEVAAALHDSSVLDLESKLWNIPGLGSAQIAKILASFELGRRFSRSVAPRETKLTSPRRVCEYVKPYFNGLIRECFFVLLVDVKNRPIRFERIAVGNQESVTFLVRDVFSKAVLYKSSGIICVHNHPSGDANPSTEDDEVTQNIISAAKVLGIRFLDHIIFAEKQAYSFSEKKLIVLTSDIS